jgi:hypothetical protein
MSELVGVGGKKKALVVKRPRIKKVLAKKQVVAVKKTTVITKKPVQNHAPNKALKTMNFIRKSVSKPQPTKQSTEDDIDIKTLVIRRIAYGRVLDFHPNSGRFYQPSGELFGYLDENSQLVLEQKT